ncbi:MAG: hypothetical protein BWX61_01454 [Bacteroidetes bacterium ADurb.Bin035]|nr:MAG: hypothetical protein BWX61_01454 [Bacteroidetes bacterium ADurb.Bin035]
MIDEKLSFSISLTTDIERSSSEKIIFGGEANFKLFSIVFHFFNKSSISFCKSEKLLSCAAVRTIIPNLSGLIDSTMSFSRFFSSGSTIL